MWTRLRTPSTPRSPGTFSAPGHQEVGHHAFRSPMSRYDAEYVLPLRWHDDHDLADLTAYLRELSQLLDVTVVDSSQPALFEAHRRAWAGIVRHLKPQQWPGRNGKVRNVMTGLRSARHERVILADDDVRYEAVALARGLQLLEGVDLVVPQNVFTAWPWHARWDTARQVINRAFGGDYPGTVFVRRSVIATEGYDGDVLFENLQLMRTVAAGGSVHRALDLYVGRRPPTSRHFRSQRVRQAYDDFAQPARLVTEAMLLPTAVLAWRCSGARSLAAAAAVGVVLAETGRRRSGGRTAFPATTSLWAPVWLIERAVCIWLAIGLRCIGGVRYSDGRIRHAATTPRQRRPQRLPENTRIAA